MRLARLYLRNYVGIYNGLVLEEILIDFSKATHSITVIKGDNGSGKSTILKAINPEDRKSTRLNSSHSAKSRMPSSA